MIKDLKYNGYTATPSDYECPDGELAASFNLTPEDGAMHPVLPPTELYLLPNNWSVMFLHDNNGFKHYIVFNTVTKVLSWFDDTASAALSLPVNIDEAILIGDGTSTGNKLMNLSTMTLHQVAAVGNTLVLLTTAGIYYFLWKNNTYISLGNKIPEVSLSFSLTTMRNVTSSEGLSLSSNWSRYKDDHEDFSDDDRYSWNMMLLGAINKLIAENATAAGLFCFPFLVRYALRLYDGSLSHHSAPVLMLPGGINAYLSNSGTSAGKVFATISAAALKYVAATPATALNNWKDLVTSVDIFISTPIYTYNQAGEVNNLYGDKPGGMCVINNSGNYHTVVFNPGSLIASASSSNPVIAIPCFDEATVEKNIKECANFYLLKSIPLDELKTTNVYNTSSNFLTRETIDVGNDYLQSLSSREVMTDDYQTNDTLIPTISYNFNGRLNIASIVRSLYDGVSPFSAFAYHDYYNGSHSGKYPVAIYVTLERDGKEITVKKTAVIPQSATSMTLCFVPEGCVYFFYPDTQAKHAILQLGSDYYDMPLSKHTSLNGAFFFSLSGPQARNITNNPLPTVSSDKTIPLPNKIYTSEVNNPFFFPLLCINTVGTGDIIGICAATKALSQGQFGQFPLYAFTTEGVWALETSATGSYTARQPITRDVCNNPDSITQLDDSVLFATDRGIMLLSGSTTQCITDAINSDSPFTFSDLFATTAARQQFYTLLTNDGYDTSALTQVPFSTFLAACRIIYDYVHQRIIIYNTAQNYAYIYSLKDHKWGMMTSDIDYGINSYPDALAVTDSNKVVNLCNSVTTGSVKGILVTRPLKLDHPDALKTIDTIIQRGKFDFLKSGRTPKPIRTILYGSRDLYHWFMIASSTDHNLRGFSGTPYKYFRIVLLCDLNHDESIYGATIQYRPRYQNRLR